MKISNFQNWIKSLVDQTYFLIKDKTAATIKIATVYHSHGSDYSLKSCSSAELFSASSDKSNIFF